jgi:hypothetical protein
MKNALLKFIAIAAMHVATIGAVQAQTPAGPNRPATVPSGYVITPFGYFHPSCVGHLAEGDVLRSEQHFIQHADGSTAQIYSCNYPHYRADGEMVYGDERKVTDPNISHSWIVAADCVASSTSACYAGTTSFGLLSAEWSVPYAPASNDGQTLYFFPGLEDINDVVTIIQPVLGWNGDFASAWGIASWNCCVTGTAYEATPQRVSPGDTIYGAIACSAGCTGGNSSSSWNVVATDMQNGKSSQLLNTSSFKQIFNWAFSGVLEVYNVKQCTDFPGNSLISFNDVQLANNLGQLIANPKWAVTSWASGLTPQCNYNVNLPIQAIITY